MAEERIGTADDEPRTYWAWTELFRTFQVALDPKKLVLAAAGIFVMWLGWWVLAVIFYNGRAAPRESDYESSYYVTKYDLSEADAKSRAKAEFDRDKAEYDRFEALAGPRGWLRVAPWDEDRGPNPFLLVTGQLGAASNWRGGRNAFDWLVTQQVPVLIEPLVKFLHPIGLLLNPHVGGVTRFYLLLVTLWTLVTWAFFGGAITRLAVVQMAGKERPGFVETLRFIAARYLSYLAAPLVPLIFVGLIALLFIIYGLIHLIPVVGDVADSVVYPILVLLGFGQTILLVGLVGYPLMYATVSAEGSDTFDALSRSYNYVFQSPWSYIWYSLVAILYGAVVVFFVVFIGSMVVYLTRWSLAQTPWTDHFASRKVDLLFRSAPESFHWRELLAPGVRDGDITMYNKISTFFVTIWVTIIFLLMIGFAYSYYFSAFSMVYLLMRRKVDDTEIDEVYLEEDEPEEPLLPPGTPGAHAAGAPPGTAQPLQMVEAPVLRTPTGDGSPPAPAPAETRPPESPPSGG
jgi:hypothetical protein